MNRDKFFIGGDWVDPAGNDTLAVISMVFGIGAGYIGVRALRSR